MRKILIFAFLFVVNAFIWSQSQLKDTISLDETVIMGKKVDQTMPVTYIDISKKTIDRQNNGQEPSQILTYLPSISAYSDAGNFVGYSYFRLRGIDQTRINMTLDGVPLNEPEDQGAYFSNFPDFFNSLQSVQVQRGVGTSSNGVASYAGSINFQAVLLRGESASELGANYGSYNSYRFYGEHQSIYKQDQGFYVRASALGTDGYKYHSGNKSYSAFFSGGLVLGNHQLKLTGFVGDQRNEMAWIGVTKEQIDKDPRTNADSDEDDHFLQTLWSLQHTWTIKQGLTQSNTIYYNFLEGNYDFDLNNYLGYHSTDEMYNYDFQHHFKGFISNINWYRGLWKINGGINVNSYNRRHIGSERTSGELYRNKGFKDEFSSYVKVRFSPGKFHLYADVQYRYTNFDYSGSVAMDKLEWNFVNPKVGMVYDFAKDWNVYYSFGRSGREPTRNDIFNGEDDLLEDDNGGPAINTTDAEYVNDHEFGIRWRNDKIQLSLNGYYMNFEDELVLNGNYGPNGLALHSNVDQSFRSGLELDVNVTVAKNVSLFNQSNFSHNKITEDGVEFSPILTPEILINQGVSYKSQHFQTQLLFRYQGASYIDFANEYSVPSFYTLNWQGVYVIKNLEFKVNIDNLTDQKIISNGYLNWDGTPLYFVQAPLHFNIGVTWNLF